MAVGGLFRSFFAKPTPERRLLKLTSGRPIRRVVELGVSSLETTTLLLKTLVKQARGEEVRYTALDAFEERPDTAEPLPLMTVYQRLTATSASVRLSPGRIAERVACEANSLADTDLLLIPTAWDGVLDQSAWSYVPRMCHPGTLVLELQESSDETSNDWIELPLQQVAQRGEATPDRMVA